MDLRAEILKEHSKQQTVKLAQWVSQDKKRFAELMRLFFQDDSRIAQRASWVVKYVADENPGWIRPYLKEMLEYCRRPVHDAVKRNMIRIMQDIDIPENIQGLAAGVCFDFLASPETPVAIKAFSMTVLRNLAMIQPGLKRELIMMIEDQLEWEKTAFRSRGKKILKELKGVK